MNTIPSICIVDDDADYRLLLQQVFKKNLLKYTVYFFDSGINFLDKLPLINPKPGLIILDQHMPEITGLQVLSALKSHPEHRTLPVVMMSGEASEEEIKDLYKVGANLFFQKGLGIAPLVETLSAVCSHWLDFEGEINSQRIL